MTEETTADRAIFLRSRRDAIIDMIYRPVNFMRTINWQLLEECSARSTRTKQTGRAWWRGLDHTLPEMEALIGNAIERSAG
ncbi:hypothetical protein ABIC09_007391 [Bradyrhizobium sp. S3.12.5]|uniref:hypothetical protein n=1 Tax=Bradyrhizobium sp. S3.12.5 TaxID=3156386 RepID=UPI0033941304